MAKETESKRGKLPLEEAGKKGSETRAREPKEGKLPLKEAGKKPGEARAKKPYEGLPREAKQPSKTIEEKESGFSKIGKTGGETRGKERKQK